MATETINLPSPQTAHRDERIFLDGPQPRRWELRSVFRIMQTTMRPA